MPSLFDLFNSTFFIILGIMLLVVALLVVYFENKMREQNHKIASMLSLVSSLAEEVNGVKFGINHLVMRGGVTESSQNENITLTPTNHLITVSDGEDDSEDDDDNSEDNSEDDSEDDSEDEQEEDDYSEEGEDDGLDIDADSIDENTVDELINNDIKILKLNINNTEETNSYDNDLELEQADDFDDLEDLEDFKSESSKTPELSNNIDDDVLELHEINEMSKHDFNNENENELAIFDISSTNLKTININLEEHVESIDYKKVTLAKLRSIVAEKGLTNDASKLKKNELLKLLGVE
jgi:hypothetical protein